MRFIFDASAMALRNYTKAGAYRYGLEVLQHMPEHLEDDEELELFFNFFRKEHLPRMHETIELGGNLKSHCCRLHPKLMRSLKVSLENKIGKHAVYHGPFDRILHTKQSARVLTIQDLAFLRAPKGMPKAWVEELTATVPESAKRAHRIITGSEFSKTDIVEWLHIPAERVKVIPHGVNESIKPSADRFVDGKLLKERYGIDHDFILYLGTLQPNKNIENLCAAFQELRRGGYEGQLVLAGNEGWLFDEMWARIVDKGHDQGVVRSGYVEEDDISRLYSCCSCFALVSVLEGFGIPVIEAMACGAPVVVADSCSLPEVAGGAAVVVDPWDYRSIAEGLHEVVSNEEERKQMREKGLKRAKMFRWDTSAKQHLEVYREAHLEVSQ